MLVSDNVTDPRGHGPGVNPTLAWPGLPVFNRCAARPSVRVRRTNEARDQQNDTRFHSSQLPTD